MTFEKWIGVHTGGAHYLDHLGVLCEGLEIPLYITELSTFEAAKEFYPRLQAHYIDIQDLSLSFLAERADVIFESGHTFATELLPLLELVHQKKMRVVYCPHGNSDKKSPKLKKDLALVYGDHMQHHLSQTGEDRLSQKLIVTGNYRAVHDNERKEWIDQKLQKLIDGRLSKDRKTVFYAPTWDNQRWFEKAERVIQEVGSEFNLLLRLHPFIEELYPVEYEKIKRDAIVDLASFPSIYPILRKADCYLGDFSSIGYDFLSLNKPMFFLDHFEGEIFECGTVLNKNLPYGIQMKAFEEPQELSLKRNKLAQRVFGRERAFKEIRDEIKEALSCDRASWIAV